MSIEAKSVDGVSRTIVPAAEWERAREAMTAKEKAHMRAGDALAAERRAMPWTRLAGAFEFEGIAGKTNLEGLFAGGKHLLVYHFMFGPKVEGWPDAACRGCSMFADQIGHLDHLRARGVEMAFVSPAPIGLLQAYRSRMGWSVPWYSGTEEFNRVCGVSAETGHSFGLNVLYRDGEDVYRTHFVGRRGVEALGTVWSLLDLTAFGRGETWEDAPAGTPQGKPYEWWRRHGEYAKQTGASCRCGTCT